MQTVTSSPEATEALAAELALLLDAGDVVAISGELGAGKTTFVRGACRALGVTAPVTSPTFTIGRRYEGGRWPHGFVPAISCSCSARSAPGRRRSSAAPVARSA